MKYEKYLPIGTVVLLKNGKKRVMITGFYCQTPEIKDTIFDYMGCVYPEGYITTSTALLFNHNQIEKIYYIGLSDAEEKDFKNKLIQHINNINKN